MSVTREQANELLDAIKNGADAPQQWINDALIATGDIDKKDEGAD